MHPVALSLLCEILSASTDLQFLLTECLLLYCLHYRASLILTFCKVLIKCFIINFSQYIRIPAYITSSKTNTSGIKKYLKKSKRMYSIIECCLLKMFLLPVLFHKEHFPPDVSVFWINLTETI